MHFQTSYESLFIIIIIIAAAATTSTVLNHRFLC
jgi:hypothetical protein